MRERQAVSLSLLGNLVDDFEGKDQDLCNKICEACG